MAAAAFREDRVLGVEFVTRLEGRLAFTAGIDAHVLGGDALNAAVVVVEDFRSREAWEHVDAGVLRLLAQPSAEIPERERGVAVVLGFVRNGPRGQEDAVGLVDEVVEEIVRDRHAERCALLAGIRKQLVHRLRGEDGARDDVGADFRTLLDEAHHELGIGFRGELHQPASRCQSGGATADDHDVEFHRLTGFFGHASPP